MFETVKVRKSVEAVAFSYLRATATSKENVSASKMKIDAIIQVVPPWREGGGGGRGGEGRGEGEKEREREIGGRVGRGGIGRGEEG